MLADLLTLDHTLLRWLHAGAAPPWLVLGIASVTFLGSGWTLLALLPGFLCPALRARASWLLGAALGTSLLVFLAKAAIGRARPCHVHEWANAIHVTAPTSPSFPSGHSAGSFAFAAFVFAMHRRWGILAVAFASLVALSRVALGVHYPSDILAGAVLGTVVGSLCGARATKNTVNRHLGSHPRRHRSRAEARPFPPGRCLQDTPPTQDSRGKA